MVGLYPTPQQNFSPKCHYRLRRRLVRFMGSISATEALILSIAGDGSKAEGFRNLLGIYQELRGLGYRSDMSIASFINGRTG
jgi:hypothetical protein